MALLHLEKIPAGIRDAFARKVTGIATSLSVNPDWLMHVMWSESKLNPQAANRQGRDRHLVAAGLLQFTAGSGIVKGGKVPSLASILSMPALAQLDLVQWYFTPYRSALRSYYDVYAVTFFPALIGKPDYWVLQTKGLSATTIARQNPAIAKGKSALTVADFKRYVASLVPRSLRDRLLGALTDSAHALREETEDVADALRAHTKESVGLGAGVLIGLCLLGWAMLHKG